MNTSAAKRFVRNALWEAEEQGREGGGAQSQGKDPPTEGPDGGSVSDGKRKRRLSEEDTATETSKKTRL